MAVKDLTTKNLSAIPEVFADIFNGIVFYDDEKIKIDPLKLKDLPTESIYYDEDGNIRNMMQDVFKEYGDQQFALVSLGLESQANVERSMPIRILGYVYSACKRQLDRYTQRRRFLLEYKGKTKTPEEKEFIARELKEMGRFELTPIVIIVLNFSGKTWNEPKSLSKLINNDNPYKEYISDYSIKVVDLHLLDDEDYKRFSSDFGPVINFLNADSKSFKGVLQELKYPIEAIDMINSYKKLVNYEKIRKEILERSEKGESINMGKLVDVLIAEGIAEGIEQGIEQGIEKGKKEGGYLKIYELVQKKILTPEEGADNLNISVEQLKANMANTGFDFPKD